MMVFSQRCNATYIAHSKNFACEFTGKFKVGFFRGADFFQNHTGNFLFCPHLKISNRSDFYFQNSPGLMDRKTAFSIFFSISALTATPVATFFKVKKSYWIFPICALIRCSATSCLVILKRVKFFVQHDDVS